LTVTLDGLGKLTDEHSASSYGQPVLVREEMGEALGPGDLMELVPMFSNARPASELVASWLKVSGDQLDEDDRAFVERFLGSLAPARAGS